MIKHPQERNKLHQEVQRNEREWSSTTSIYKNHQRAKLRGTQEQKRSNPLKESMYFIFINEVKELYKTLANPIDKVIVEVPLKKHPLDSEAIHSFMTPHFIAQLECNISNSYYIEYKFHNCPFENQLKTLMTKFGLDRISRESPRIDNYPQFFTNVLRCQPERFIYQV